MSSKEQLSEYIKRLKVELATKNQSIDGMEQIILKQNRLIVELKHTNRENYGKIQRLLEIVNHKSVWRKIFPIK